MGSVDGECGWGVWMGSVDGECGWGLWMGIVEDLESQRRTFNEDVHGISITVTIRASTNIFTSFIFSLKKIKLLTISHILKIKTHTLLRPHNVNKYEE
jgi:hypothetical protein